MTDSVRDTWAVVPAGGSGTRFSSTDDKLLADLYGQPVLCRTLDALIQAPSIAGIILVASAQNQAFYQERVSQAWYHFFSRALPIQVVLGGRDRRESVFHGLQALPASASFVAVHDAARPLIQPNRVEEAIQQVRAQPTQGVVVGIPVYDTLKRVDLTDGHILETLDRRPLWRAQTPQVFSVPLLLQAHQRASLAETFTDDAQLVEATGVGTVVMTQGDERNLKITTAEDLRLAAALLQAGSV